MRILVIDNYDSFVYNLVQALRVLGADVEVVRNDALTPADAARRDVDRIVISPGPCTPNEAGLSVGLCREARVPLLGVCLGHQALVQAFGGVIGRCARIVHGKTSPVSHGATGLFSGLPEPFAAARYHSLIATSIPDCFDVTAETADHAEPMAVRHKERPLFGVQFHPESFLTPDGPVLLRNFLELESL